MNHMLPNSQRWAAEELASAALGDARLTKRFVRIVADKVAKPSASIPQASGDWAATKATYRFLAADHITPEALRAAAYDATLRRVQAHDTILLLQDTTELNYTSHPHTTDLGALDNAHARGLKVHSGLATTLAGVPLGLLHQAVWSRPAPTKGRPSRRTRPQAKRESQRWLTTLEAVQQRVPQTTRLIVVADREADIYPLFIHERDSRTDLVIRATYNRGIVGGKRLEDVTAELVWQGSSRVDIPGNGQRAGRTATVRIGWAEVQVLPPTDYPAPAAAPRPSLNLIVVEESGPPVGVQPLRWLLWTTLAVESWEDAVRVVEIYRARWLIER